MESIMIASATKIDNNTTPEMSDPLASSSDEFEYNLGHNTKPETHLDSQNSTSIRSMEELKRLLYQDDFDSSSISDEEIIRLMIDHHISVHRLESILGKKNAKRCVEIRRKYYSKQLELLDRLPELVNPSQPESITTGGCDHEKECNELESRASSFKKAMNTEFDYNNVIGACCENVIGCVRLPVGLVGPFLIDDRIIHVPLATTEGCLVASTSRGVSALNKSGGVVTRIRKDRMTRAPIVRFRDTDLRDALNKVDKLVDWLNVPVNKARVKLAFDSTSKHIKMVDYTLHPIGREVHIRFEAQTGDAMGMNMTSKAAEIALGEIQKVFPTMVVLSLSGNMCTDKKSSAINWTFGRGKSVECSAILPAQVVKEVFKTDVDSLIDVWLKKVMVGSAMAGGIGSFNCHAANVVAAIFIATGQDAAQVVSSSNCILTLEKESRNSLAVHCKMPSIECGTVGGGTILSDQSNYLQLMGIKGPTKNSRGDKDGSTDNIKDANATFDSDSNSCKLARIICATVTAAELSLLASLTEGTLVKSHMAHNRSSQPCNVV